MVGPVLPPSVVYCADAFDAATGCNALVILTEWNQFRSLDLDHLKGVLARPLVVDLRNIYDPVQMAERGFEYHSVGRAAKDFPI